MGAPGEELVWLCSQDGLVETGQEETGLLSEAVTLPPQGAPCGG